MANRGFIRSVVNRMMKKKYGDDYDEQTIDFDAEIDDTLNEKENINHFREQYHLDEDLGSGEQEEMQKIKNEREWQNAQGGNGDDKIDTISWGKMKAFNSKASSNKPPGFRSKFSIRGTKTTEKKTRPPEAPIRNTVSRMMPKPMPTTAQRLFGTKVGLNNRALLGFLPYEQRDNATHLQKFGFDKHETHNVMERHINPQSRGPKQGVIKRGIRGDNLLKW